jgi:6-phospho-beta-glucosidase
MKIAVLGAAGVRTPLIIEAVGRRQERLGLTELALMDIDGERLGLIDALTAMPEPGFRSKLTFTTDAPAALSGADFVITTFRAGGIDSRVIDEQVPLGHGVLGQETTGPGGFAMGLRSIPVLLAYVKLMAELCPAAWLINFANPAGMLAEAATRNGGWSRTVGICDSPQVVTRIAAALLRLPADEIFLDYFGLNHLGWSRAVIHNQRDYLPQLIDMIQNLGQVPGIPFDPDLIAALQMIPNEYLYYYYSSRQAVQHILESGGGRGEQVAALNRRLFDELKQRHVAGDLAGMREAYEAYLRQRGESYMTRETGLRQHGPLEAVAGAAPAGDAAEGEGYAGVALDLIEALSGARPRQMILNVPNQGAIQGMAADAVVEVPAFVSRGLVRPLAVGAVPEGCLGLMSEVKVYERLTIAAAQEGSYALARQALAVHPLLRDFTLAGTILDEYRARHGNAFPQLK